MTGPGTSGETLRGAVTTGRDNPVTIRPFHVRLRCPARWDPSAERLPVDYDILDRNGRIRRGRLRYTVTTADGEVTICRQALRGTALEHGLRKELAEADRWDGTIREGIRDRNGDRITAELSPVSVYLEAWNTEEDEPAATAEGGQGRTEREDEWLAQHAVLVDIDSVRSAVWDRNWAVPRFSTGHDDHDEGEVTLTIEVRNVREGESVRVEVARLVEEGESVEEHFYVDGADPETQPGLQDLVVRDGRVVRDENGAKPSVVFNNYEMHWTLPGYDFYAFSIAFGEQGGMLAASARRAPGEGEQDGRLNLRYPVFIHAPSSGLTATARAARRLHAFLRGDTTYWRSYLLPRPASGPFDWFRRAARKYAVFFEGHAACGCDNRGTEPAGTPATNPPASDGHPTYTVGSGASATWKFKRLPGNRFAPDQNRCPRDISTARVGGCGTRPWVLHQLCLERSPTNATSGACGGKRMWLGNVAGRTERDGLHLIVEDRTQETGLYRTDELFLPRFLFFADGCRTMLTTNLGEHYVEGGVRYYHGWIYSAPDSLADFFVDVMQKWIRGTSENPAPSECDPGRFLTVYLGEARRTRARRRYHPRLLEGSTVHNRTESPSAGVGPGEALA